DEEETAITAARAGEAAALEEAGWALVRAQAAVAACEHELAALTRHIAAGEAEGAAIARRIGELEQRLERLTRRRTELGEERARLEAAAAGDETLAAARAAVAEAEERRAGLQEELARAEAERVATATREAEGRRRLGEAQAEFSRIAAEADALSALFAAESQLWPPLIDAVTVETGYEAALGAALGDDLAASTDLGAPLHWRMPEPDEAAPALPDGAEPLSRYVQGPPQLARRLAQIGVATDAAQGTALAPLLRQGQRLVTRDGALWRWDGYTVGPGALAAASARRLEQRNRLNALTPQRAVAEEALTLAQAEYEAAHAAAVSAAEQERVLRQQVQAAFAAAARAREALDEATRRVNAASARLAAVVASLEEAETAAAETETALAAARAEQAALPDLAGARKQVARLQQELAAARARLLDGRSAEERVVREAESRRARLAAMAEERRSWAERR
ncbi:MAG: hypothetical protein IRY94_20305, partial [Rhodospirillaceae bacterium]|nr:hypothetical protein [Rhodospirillaceae bacterium]